MYKKRVLKNGLRVITVPRPDTEAVTVLVLVGAGSRYENQRNSGVAHFVEHMMFKGTKRRPTTEIISRELDRYGADYNAYTGKDHTGYYIKIASEHLDLALDMLSDMLLHSRLDADEINRERNVILEEIKMYNDNPMMLAPELFERILFGAEHPLGRSIAGTAQTVSSMKRSQFLDFLKQNYTPRHSVIGIAGNFNGLSEEKLAKRVESYFSFSQKSSPAKPYQRLTSFPSRNRLLIHQKNTEQVQLTLGMPGYSYFHKERFAATLLSIILGGNMSSRLFIRVRERLGLAYFVRASADSYQDVGSFEIRAGVDPTKIDKAVTAIIREIRLAADRGVSARELKDAKEYVKGKMLLSLEDSSALAEWFARQEVLLGKMVTPHERLKELARVTREDVHRVAAQLFRKRFLYLSLIGPFDQSAVPHLKSLVER